MLFDEKLNFSKAHRLPIQHRIPKRFLRKFARGVLQRTKFLTASAGIAGATSPSPERAPKGLHHALRLPLLSRSGSAEAGHQLRAISTAGEPRDLADRAKTAIAVA